MYTVYAVKNNATGYCENFVDFDKAKAAFDSINISDVAFADLIDDSYNTLLSKYHTACGDVHVWDRTI